MWHIVIWDAPWCNNALRKRIVVVEHNAVFYTAYSLRNGTIDSEMCCLDCPTPICIAAAFRRWERDTVDSHMITSMGADRQPNGPWTWHGSVAREPGRIENSNAGAIYVLASDDVVCDSYCGQVFFQFICKDDINEKKLPVRFFGRHMHLNLHIHSWDVWLSDYDLKSCANTYYVNNDNASHHQGCTLTKTVQLVRHPTTRSQT